MQSSRMRAVVLTAALATGPACAAVQNYLDVSGPRYAGEVAPQPVSGIIPAEAGPHSLRIVTFNIKYSRQIDRAIDLLSSEGPLLGADIIALQEMDAEGVERIARALGLAYVYYPAAVHPRADKDFGNAVLVRGRIEEDHKLILPHAGRFGGMRRIAVAATARVGGQRLRIYSIHLGTPKDLSGAARKAQVDAIVEDARNAGLPVVVAGDCNARGGVAAAFRAAGFRWPTEGVGRTISLFSWDHVFVRGLEGGSVLPSGAVDSRGASDHRAVWVELPPQPAAQPPAPLLEAPALSIVLPAATPAIR
jgi:endonuclease/exonuclease/phosphatase family metal-dependent hydrolase